MPGGGLGPKSNPARRRGDGGREKRAPRDRAKPRLTLKRAFARPRGNRIRGEARARAPVDLPSHL